jgi:hypothetical protein
LVFNILGVDVMVESKFDASFGVYGKDDRDDDDASSS